MPKIYDLSDGRSVEFSDDTPDEAIGQFFQSGAIQVEKPRGLLEETGRGLAAGTIGVVESFAKAAEVATPYPINKLPAAASDYLTQLREDIGPKAPERGLVDVYEDEGFKSAAAEAFNPYRLMPQLAEFVPQVASMFLPGAVIGRAAKGAEAATGLAKVLGLGAGGVKAAQTLGGGLMAGMQEASSVYDEALATTGDPVTARTAYMGTLAVSGLLNAAGFEAITSKLPKGTLGRLGAIVAKGGFESLTEYLEEPAQAIVLEGVGINQDMREVLRRAVDVIPASFLAGGGAGVFSPATQAEIRGGGEVANQTDDLPRVQMTEEQKAAFLHTYDIPEDMKDFATKLHEQAWSVAAWHAGEEPTAYYNKHVMGYKKSKKALEPDLLATLAEAMPEAAPEIAKTGLESLSTEQLVNELNRAKVISAENPAAAKVAIAIGEELASRRTLGEDINERFGPTTLQQSSAAEDAVPQRRREFSSKVINILDNLSETTKKMAPASLKNHLVRQGATKAELQDLGVDEILKPGASVDVREVRDLLEEKANPVEVLDFKEDRGPAADVINSGLFNTVVAQGPKTDYGVLSVVSPNLKHNDNTGIHFKGFIEGATNSRLNDSNQLGWVRYSTREMGRRLAREYQDRINILERDLTAITGGQAGPFSRETTEDIARTTRELGQLREGIKKYGSLKRTLYIEEVQSTGMQQIEDEIKKAKLSIKHNENTITNSDSTTYMHRNAVKTNKELQEEILQLEQTPFLHSWRTILLKQALHKAAAEGFDAVVITGAEEQHQRGMKRPSSTITDLTPNENTFTMRVEKNKDSVNPVYEKEFPASLQKLLAQKGSKAKLRKLSEGESFGAGGDFFVELDEATREKIKNEPFTLYAKKKGVAHGAIDVILNKENELASKIWFRGITAPNFSTAMHETAHAIALVSKGALRESIEEGIGKPFGKWAEKDHEKYAQGFERWLIRGEVPENLRGRKEDWESTFTAVKEEMSRIYKGNSKMLKAFMTPELAEAFDTMIGGPTLSEGLIELQQMSAGMLAAIDADDGERTTLEQRASISSKLRLLDKEYLATEDHVTREKILRKAAKLAGFRDEVFLHGGPYLEGDSFDRNKIGSSSDEGYFGEGYSFTDKYDVAAGYSFGTGGGVNPYFLKMRNPFRVIVDDLDLSGSIDFYRQPVFGNLAELPFEQRAKKASEILVNKGYDSVEITTKRGQKEFLILPPFQNHIKAYRETYTEDSEILPSQRFDVNKTSTLYQRAPVDRRNSMNFDKFPFETALQEGLAKTMFGEMGAVPSVTNAETILKAEKALKNKAWGRRLIARLIEDGAANSYEAVAIEILYLQKLKLLERLYVSGRPKDFDKEYEHMMANEAKAMQNVKSNAGRTLQVQNKIAENMKYKVEIMKLADKANALQLRVINQIDWTSPTSIKQAHDLLQEGVGKSLMKSLYFNGILSGPTTQGVNFFSNWVNLMYTAGDRAVVGTIDGIVSKLVGREQKTFARESIYWTKAALKALNPATQAGRNAWDVVVRGGEGGTGATKIDEEIGPSLRVFETMFGESKPGKLAAGVLNSPTRLLRGTDVYFKTLAMEAEGQAFDNRVNQAIQSGKMVEFVEQVLREESLKSARVPLHARLLKGMNLQEQLRAVREHRLDRIAENTTFQDVAGNFTRGMLSIKKSLPWGMGDIFVPFVQTITNIAKRGLELTPGVGIALGKIKREVEYDGKKVKVQNLSNIEIAAKQLEGLMLAGMVWSLMEAGLLVGDEPEDKAEREAFYRSGKLPFSVKFGDTYYSFRSISPFAIPLTAIAKSYQAWGQIQESNLDPAAKKQGILDLVMATVNSVRVTLIDNLYFKNLAGYLGDKYSFKQQIHFTAGGFVPYSSFWRSMRRAYEAGATGQVALRENSTFMDTFGQALPLTYDFQERLGLNPPDIRRNYLGEPVARDSSFFREWLPIRYQAESLDPVENELQAIGLYPGMPGQVITVRGVPVRLDDEQYSTYLTRYGTLAKEQTRRMMGRAGYQNRPPAQRAEILDRLLARIRERELGRLRAEIVRSGQL